MATAGAALGTIFIFVDGLIQAETHAQTAFIKGSLIGKVAVLMAAAMYSMGTMRISQVAGGALSSNLV